MIHILSWTTKIIKKHFPGHYKYSKNKKIQEIFKDLHGNLRTFQGKWNSRTSPKIQGLFKTVQTLEL